MIYSHARLCMICMCDHVISTVLQFTKTELCNNNTLKVGHLEYLGNSVVIFLCVYMFRVVVVVVVLLL